MDKLKMHSPDLTVDNITRLRELFPGCVTEARGEDGSVKPAVDFDQLRQELSDAIVEGPQERYHLNWPGKREALLTANAPIARTLRPCRDESVDFDTTKNLFIEGDNLDALKLLQETYLGKVKMIYIDPPYNTGKDFIYKGNFTSEQIEHQVTSGERTEEGVRLVANPEGNGRFGDLFDLPKDEIVLQKVVEMLTEGDDIVVDFFAGSSTTAHSVMLQNANDGGNRRFVMVQLDENTNEDSAAYQAGFKTIPAVSRERIRRAGKSVLAETCHEQWNKDTGFRVLKIDTSNMADVYYAPDALDKANLDLFVDSLPLTDLDHRLLLPLVGQANAALARYDGLLQGMLYEEMKLAIQAATHSQYTVHVLDAIFSKPIFRSSDLTAQLKREFGIHEKTTPGLLRQMRNADILRELQAGSGRRPATFCFPRLINLAEGHEIL